MMNYQKKASRFELVKVLSVIAVSGIISILVGCNDPSTVGRYKAKPVTNIILDSLGVVDEEPMQFANARDPEEYDLKVLEEEYRLQAGDVVDITILDLFQTNVEWIGRRQVSESGRITLPELGTFSVAGRTEMELIEDIKDLLSPNIIVDPKVSVVVTASTAKVYSISGAVAYPNRYPLLEPDFRILEAIAQSGGIQQVGVDYAYVVRAVDYNEIEYVYEDDSVIDSQGMADLVVPEPQSTLPDSITPAPMDFGGESLTPAKPFDPLVPAPGDDKKSTVKPSLPALPFVTPVEKKETPKVEKAEPVEHVIPEPVVPQPAVEDAKPVEPTPVQPAAPETDEPQVEPVIPVIPTTPTPEAPADDKKADEQPAQTEDKPEEKTPEEERKDLLDSITPMTEILTPVEVAEANPKDYSGKPDVMNNEGVNHIYFGFINNVNNGSSEGIPDIGYDPADLDIDGNYKLNATKDAFELVPGKKSSKRTMKKAPGKGNYIARRPYKSLDQAGGISIPEGTYQEVIRVDLKALQSGDLSQNIVIRPGDYIRVQYNNTGLFYVMGQIARPGPYTLSGDRMTLKQVLAIAGPMTQLANTKRCDITRRIGRDKEVTCRINLDRLIDGSQPDIFIKPNDMINFGSHPLSRWIAVIRQSFRTTYGFGFVYDRNLADKDFSK